MFSSSAVPNDPNGYLNHLLEHIAEDGVTVQHVIGDHTGPSYSYTIGLTAIPHPEIVVAGMHPDWAGRLLGHLGHEIVEHGVWIEPGLAHLHEWPPMYFLWVTHPGRRMGWAAELYGPRVAGLQLVNTDDDNRYPWDPGYDARTYPQPLLGQNPAPALRPRPRTSGRGRSRKPGAPSGPRGWPSAS